MTNLIQSFFQTNLNHNNNPNLILYQHDNDQTVDVNWCSDFWLEEVFFDMMIKIEWNYTNFIDTCGYVHSLSWMGLIFCQSVYNDLKKKIQLVQPYKKVQ